MLTFLIMFLPRSRQLVAMGKEEMFLDCDEDIQQVMDQFLFVTQNV